MLLLLLVQYVTNTKASAAFNTLTAFSDKRSVTVWRPSVHPSVR